RQRQHRRRRPQLRDERLQVAGEVLDLPLLGGHDQQRPVGEEERREQARGAAEAGHLGALAAGKGIPQASESDLHLQAREPRGEGAGGHQPCRMRSSIAVVDLPGTISTRTTRPPAASTSSRPTMASSPQSAPFTRTSGASAFTTSRGVGSSYTTTRSTASRARSVSARSASGTRGRPSPLIRRTEPSELIATTRTSPWARAASSRARCPEWSRSKQPLVRTTRR